MYLANDLDVDETEVPRELFTSNISLEKINEPKC
jgi:hypothetical protein